MLFGDQNAKKEKESEWEMNDKKKGEEHPKTPQTSLIQYTPYAHLTLNTMRSVLLHSSKRLCARSPRSLTLTTNVRCLSSKLPSTGDENALATTKETALAHPIDFDSSSSIQGEESQILQVQLKPNQVLRAESGAMLFMTSGVEMSTSLGADEGSSALSTGFKRMLTGQNMFISDYRYNGEEGTAGTVALGTDFPSKIIRFSLPEYGNKIICQKSAYLASSLDVDIQMEFTKKFTAGFFGGEGFILQGLTGSGDVFIKAGGTLVKKDLKEGETLRVSSGSLVAFTQDVEFDVQTMPGFKNVMFGGEGLFITTLTGPGTVWLQGMPPDRMISEIARRVPSGGGIGLGIPIGLGGGGSAEGREVDGSTADDSPIDGESPGVGEDMVAATDTAVEADRNATIASSGFDGVDSESASSLFGDAAPDDSPLSRTEPESDPTSSIPEMDDATSFSTQDTDFGEDLTQSNQFDDFQQDETSFSSEEFNDESFGNVVESDDGGGGIGDLLGQIWDIFSDDD